MRLLFGVILVLIYSGAVAQPEVTLSGVVQDSTTFQPLPFVAVQIKSKPIGVSTSESGAFHIACSVGDTLVFTRLGHKAHLLRVSKADDRLRILLAEDSRMLKDVTVYGDYTIKGVDDWKKDLPPNTQVQVLNKTLEPQPNEVAVFGPGITIGLGGKDKTKNKRDELSRTETYRKTISDPETKKKLIELYNLTEEQYNKKLERFNEENPDAFYLTSAQEIITMMIQFFALKD
ncbi:MAG: carboxypeptidase-like regulatory domain-containing protein [Bacteroidetes bacterium CHB5]|nr:carboxypeptidase-like regulatory domain-containing protein [Bacteroidetes bacterium CHB5]